MITNSFDPASEALISPRVFFGEKQALCEVCIATFSNVIFREMQRTLPHREVASVCAVNGERPICLTELDGKPVAFFPSSIGAALCGTDLIDVNWFTGATNFILFGSAGSLNRAATTGKYVLPTEAYRDEGMSYHYAPPADYITIRNSDKLAGWFRELGLPFVQGRVWTTDAVYRETREQVSRRQAEGCVAVDMEVAGVQAVCDFHGFELYPFLVTGDVLDGPVYDPAGLHGANHEFDKLRIALELAKRI